MEYLYIAYGAELDPAFMKRCFRRAKIVAKSWLHDYRLVFTGEPHEAKANIVQAKGYEVPVTVWKIHLSPEAVATSGHDKEYKKQFLSLEVAGEIREGLIYTPRSTKYAVPSVAHLAKIIRGYKHYNFDRKYIEEAVNYSVRKEETA